MREKYESLPLAVLRDLAKARGLKGTSSMKKSEVVEAMLEEDERQKQLEEKKAQAAAVKEPEKAKQPTVAKTEAPAKQENSAKPDAAAKQRILRSMPRQDEARQVQPAERQQTAAQAQPAQAVQAPAQPVQQATSTVQVQPTAADAGKGNRQTEVYDATQFPAELDSGIEAVGILEVMPDGYGFIRGENYLPGENDVYVAPSQIRRFGLKTGDILRGNKRIKTQQEKFSALLYVRTINGYTPEESAKRMDFSDMTPIFPDKRIKLETPGCSVAMRVMDLVSPVGKGQRGMIVSPPKAGKTTLLKEVAKSILRNNPKTYMIILLIDERPEEVTDIREAIIGENVEVIYSTFDELPEHHKRVSEMAIERAKRLVEHKEDVVILLDSITRLTRAYNQVVPPSGRTLSGGLDPSALHMPKRFFGAARNMRGGGSLTILATALVDTGSKMDDVVYEEFKGTGNMEMVLDRKLSEKRIFPAIDLAKSGTRREDLLLTSEELEAINIMRKALNGLKPDEATDRILDMFARTRNNTEFVQMVKKNKFI
ncbi:MAG: transcription termination factor Rho [Lachnospiraceae bacterium]|jgi:transcription termination factor Rho|nr:transcription termination factor Rho [Lachnospiraceae bacterium]